METEKNHPEFQEKPEIITSTPSSEHSDEYNGLTVTENDSRVGIDLTKLTTIKTNKDDLEVGQLDEVRPIPTSRSYCIYLSLSIPILIDQYMYRCHYGEYHRST